MNILIVTSEIGNHAGGLALTCYQMKNLLEEIGHTTFIESSLNEKTNLAIKGGYDPKLSTKINYSYNIKKLSEKYKEIDLVIAYGAEKNSYMASLLAKKINKKFIIVLCGSDINIALGSVDSYNYNYHSLKNADKIIGLSEELVENSKLILEKEDKVYEVIPNVYEVKNEINYKKIDFKSINFALGSTFLNEKKGVSNFIKAFAKYCHEYNRFLDKLYLFGHIDEDLKKSYYNIITETNMEKNIILQGGLDRDKYLNSLKHMDIYVQPSFFEGCCNSIGEAIFEGKFIFLSDTGYFPEILKTSFPEVIIKSLDIEEIPAILNSCVNSIKEKDYRKNLVDYLKELSKKDTILEKWEKVLTFVSEKKIIKDSCAVMFHDIENSYTGLDYHREGFRKLVELVHLKGYRLCSYREYTESKNKSNLIICTFDDAYEGIYHNAFPVLKEYNFTATVFVCPDLIGKDNDWNRRDTIIRTHVNLDMLYSLAEHNWEIGSHGLGHYNLLRLSQTNLERNLEDSKRILEDKFGKVDCFCYPFGDFNRYIKGLVTKYYDFAFSVDVGGNDYKKDRFQFTRLVPEELKKMMEEL